MELIKKKINQTFSIFIGINLSLLLIYMSMVASGAINKSQNLLPSKAINEISIFYCVVLIVINLCRTKILKREIKENKYTIGVTFILLSILIAINNYNIKEYFNNNYNLDNLILLILSWYLIKIFVNIIFIIIKRAKKWLE